MHTDGSQAEPTEKQLTYEVPKHLLRDVPRLQMIEPSASVGLWQYLFGKQREQVIEEVCDADKLLAGAANFRVHEIEVFKIC